MSQHIAIIEHNSRSTRVLMGWDRPLQGFFLVISYCDTQDDESEFLYCNLDDKELRKCWGLPKSFDHFETVLKNLNITVPREMIDETRKDQCNNVGNRVVVYNTDTGAKEVYNA